MTLTTSTAPPGAVLKGTAPESKPIRGCAQEKLNVFVGDWRGQGVGGEGTPMTATEIYAWVEGGFFLDYHFDQKVGEKRHTGVGLLGFDQASCSYFAHFVDNSGYNRKYDVRDIGGGVWQFLGERERATLNFEGDKLKIRWDHRSDGGEWSMLCEFDCVNQFTSNKGHA